MIGIIGIQSVDARPADNLRVTDLDGHSLSSIKSGQQVLLSYDLRYYALPDYEKSCIVENVNLDCSSISSKSIVVGDKILPSNYDDKAFTMIFRVQDEDSRTWYISWIDGKISASQVKNIASAWMPETSGDYTATIFFWSSLDNPTALLPPVSATITVR